jgi:hypothetical protein
LCLGNLMLGGKGLHVKLFLRSSLKRNSKHWKTPPSSNSVTFLSSFLNLDSSFSLTMLNFSNFSLKSVFYVFFYFEYSQNKIIP